MVPEAEDGPLWRPPRRELACPFRVQRTRSDNIPVYVYRRLNRNLAVTVVRKVRGDLETLRRELEVLCRRRVEEKPGGVLEIQGNYRRQIKAYFKGIGY